MTAGIRGREGETETDIRTYLPTYLGQGDTEGKEKRLEVKH